MLLQLNQLQVRYGARAIIRDMTTSIDSPALGLLGPNGAGKSTLIRALLGFIPIHAGTAMLQGLNVRTQNKKIREMTGYMPEHECTMPGMTVVRFMRMIGEMCGLDSHAAMERAHEVLFYVGLGEVRYRKMEGFSYGMLQKVRLAQALIHGPKILILDEPTNGLDPEGREEMLALLREMIQNSGSKIIISSHLLRDIEVCCQDVLVLKKGQVVAQGNIEAMRCTVQNVYEVRIKGDLQRFVGELARQGCQCEIGPREALKVDTPDGLPARAIFEMARRAGVQLRHFYAKRDSLEDIFLKALEDENGSAPEPAFDTRSSRAGL